MAALCARSLTDDLDMPMEMIWLLHGEALHEAGRHDEAVAALRRFQGLFAMNWVRPWALPRSRLLLARSLAALGRRAEAAEELGRLTHELRRADVDDPVIAEARALATQMDATLRRP